MKQENVTKAGYFLLPLFLTLTNPASLQANEQAVRAPDPDEQFVVEYMKTHRAGTFFIMNEKRGELALFERGGITATFKALSGQKKGDRNEKFITPAGIFPLVPSGDTEKNFLLFAPERTDTENHFATIHPVLDIKGQKRPERLKSKTPDDNRISDGCVNIDEADYNKIMRFVREYSAYFNGTPVYMAVLPEEQNVATFQWPKTLPAVWQIFPR